MKRVFMLNMIIGFLISVHAADLDNLKYGPVPYSPFHDEMSMNGKFVVHGQVETDAVIEYYIFTLTGNLVKSHSESRTGGIGNQLIVEWDGRNNDGRYVSDGGYIMQIKSVSENSTVMKFLKFLVIKDKQD